MDRAVDFYSKVLTFEKVSDTEVAGENFEHLEGVFGLRMRVVRMRLGEEFIELTEYLAPKGRPIPVDSRSNDRWFQHIAIIVSDMDKAYAWLRQNKVEHASIGAAASSGLEQERGGHLGVLLQGSRWASGRSPPISFRQGPGEVAPPHGQDCFSVSTTPRS